jgi:hypothetical protein
VEIPIPLPVADGASVAAAVIGGLTERTRLVVIDHVTSATALVFPVEEIVRACRARGVEVLVDAAHVPGMLDVRVEDLGCDYWTGNLHKWCCAPKGTAVLWVSPERRATVAPMTVSHFAGEGLDAEFDWQGTRDMAPWMVAGTAIDFMAELGWDRVRAHNRQMAAWVHRMLCERWELEPVSPADGSMLGSMCTVPLPAEIPARFGSPAEFQEALYRAHLIEVPVIEFGGRWHVRPSAQVYNRAEQYDLLAQAVLEHAAHAWARTPRRRARLPRSLRVDQERRRVLEVAHHLGALRFRDRRVLERAAHRVHPPVALRDADAELHVAHAQARVALAPAVVPRSAEVLDEELRLVADRLLEVLREHRAQLRMAVDARVEGPRDAPERLRSAKPLEDRALGRVLRCVGGLHAGW